MISETVEPTETLWNRFVRTFGGKQKAGANPYNLGFQRDIQWFQRAEVALSLLQSIGPVNSVADIGCADQKIGVLLKSKGIQAVYQGLDIVPQSPEVIACDIRRDDLPSYFDVAMVLGVLEYVENPTAALARLRPKVGHLIVSHVAREQNLNVTLEKQARLGWTTFVHTQAFEEMLTSAGFQVKTSVLTPDQRTRVWLCVA